MYENTAQTVLYSHENSKALTIRSVLLVYILAKLNMEHKWEQYLELYLIFLFKISY